MRGMKRTCGGVALVALTFNGGCVEALVEGFSRGLADGVAFVVEDFITQLPGQDTETVTEE